MKTSSKAKVIIAIMIACIVESSLAIVKNQTNHGSISEPTVSGIIVACFIMFVVMGVSLISVINNK